MQQNFADKAALIIAEAHAYRGEAAAAFEWLERAYRPKDPLVAWIKVDPLLTNLHSDPRFTTYLQRLQLAEPAGAQ